MKLQELTTDAREYFIAAVARGTSVQRARDELYETFPDEREYHYNMFQKWVRSEEGQALITEAKEHVLERAVTESFAVPQLRIEALVLLAEKVLKDALGEQIERVGVKESAEFRQLMTAIRTELQELEGGDERKAAFEAFIEKVQTMDMPEYLRRFLSGTTEGEEVAPETPVPVMAVPLVRENPRGDTFSLPETPN